MTSTDASSPGRADRQPVTCTGKIEAIFNGDWMGVTAKLDPTESLRYE